jgi:hypothetical protein
MKIDSETIHRLIDGEIPREQQDEVLRLILSDPLLKQEYEHLRAAVSILEREGPQEAPPDFTAAVMRKIPHVVSPVERIRSFLFGSRVLRWNVATVMAGFAVIVAAFLFIRLHDSGMPVVPGPDGARAVTVRLTFYAPRANQVAVAGTFNKWTAGSDLMERRDGGLWTIDLNLTPGRYTYMFVLDGTAWVTDPGAESYQDDGFGNRNAILKVRI